ncbi:endolytic transglycosylase MltG [Puteibacter caeruleilacunae]|nr:endolytic transglycosylase MltG [Puteibacter caeruleilacunae]
MVFPKAGKYAMVIFAAALILTAAKAFQLFGYIFDENVKIPGGIYIKQDASIEEVLDSLNTKQILVDVKAFNWVADKKKYPDNIKPGYYTFKRGLNTNQLVNILRSGQQTPVKLTFNNVRFKEEFAEKVSKYIQPSKDDILKLLNDPGFATKFGYKTNTISAMCIPNTYEVYWTITADELFNRLKKEHDRFWNKERKQKAETLKMTPEEVTTLASIMQEETQKNDEKKRMAGVYINRLKRGIPLQADPTVKFAVGDFSIRRILNEHLDIDSPYNTYKYKGLPPGPINFPDISSIDAVLNYEKHSYLYFCAKEDFSGYHNFARTLREHNKNARKYHRALNKKKIWK